jgi:glutamate-1-semialdehyde 2,1-aminomutase
MIELNNLKKSILYREKIHQLIPGGAHTYSKGDDQFPEIAPAAIVRGMGSKVWDLDGNEYLDCAMGLTSVSLGHAYKPVLDAVSACLKDGVNFQRPSHLELKMAEDFLSLLPGHHMIKFAKNGSVATTAAVKLARAYTGRPIVAFPSDHPFYSFDDWFIGKTHCNLGVPDQIQSLSLTYDSKDLNTLESLFKEYPNKISCVISEPIRSDGIPENYLQNLINLCHKYGALYIMDEMISGFKVDFPGAFSKFKVTPDLATWGKGIANGFSFCALTGKREIMELGGINNEGKEKVFLISSTHGGETHSLAACMATIKEYKDKNVIEHLHSIGNGIWKGCQKIINQNKIEDYVQVTPCDWFPIFTFRDRNKNISLPFRTLFQQEMIKRGMLFQSSFTPCFSHTFSDVELFIDAFKNSIPVYTQALDVGWEKLLLGKPVKPVFRKYL